MLLAHDAPGLTKVQIWLFTLIELPLQSLIETNSITEQKIMGRLIGFTVIEQPIFKSFNSKIEKFRSIGIANHPKDFQHTNLRIN